MSHRSSDLKNGVKATVDGLWSKWMVHGSTTGRSVKVECPEIRKWTVQRVKTGRSKGMESDGPKRKNWTVSTLDSQGIIVSARKGKKLDRNVNVWSKEMQLDDL